MRGPKLSSTVPERKSDGLIAPETYGERCITRLDGPSTISDALTPMLGARPRLTDCCATYLYQHTNVMKVTEGVVGAARCCSVGCAADGCIRPARVVASRLACSVKRCGAAVGGIVSRPAATSRLVLCLRVAAIKRCVGGQRLAACSTCTLCFGGEGSESVVLGTR